MPRKSALSKVTRSKPTAPRAALSRGRRVTPDAKADSAKKLAENRSGKAKSSSARAAQSGRGATANGEATVKGKPGAVHAPHGSNGAHTQASLNGDFHNGRAALFKTVWNGEQLDAALEPLKGRLEAMDDLVAELNRTGVELSLGLEEPPAEPRPIRARAVDARDENADPLAILFREAQRRPRPTREEERRLFLRVLFTKRRLDRTLAEFNYPKDVIDTFLRNAPCLAFRPNATADGKQRCETDGNAPCVRFANLCSMEIVHERCCAYHAARNGFVVRYLYLVLGMVRRFRDRGMDTADLVQEGSAALMRAAEDFEPERGFRFSTYARWWVNQAFLRTMYNNLRTVRLPVYLQKAAAKVMRHAGDRDFREIEIGKLSKLSGVPESTIRILSEFSRSTVSLDAAMGDRERMLAIEDSRSAFRPEKIDRPNIKNEVEKVLSALDQRERTILRLRFGLDASLPRTLEEVGEVLNLSRERVRQIQEEALGKLRSPLHLERLRDLLDVD
jgi:RNA polymerase sigma factor (sigma-70 family)